MSEESNGGTLLRVLADLAEKVAEERIISAAAKAEAERAHQRLDDLTAPAEVSERERRLGALEARLASEERERAGVWSGAQRLVEELRLEVRATAAARERVEDRWRAAGRWALDRIALPLVAAAAGALAARKGWLP